MTPLSQPAAVAIPLFVDLDLSLVKTDLHWESWVQIAFRKPWMLPGMACRRLSGKTGFKQTLFGHAAIDPACLPYRLEVLDMIRQARLQGQPVILVTDAPPAVAQAVATHLGLFDDVLGSTPESDLSGQAKREAIEQKANHQPFDYVGSLTADLPLFAQARRVVLVNPSARVARIARQQNQAAKTLRDRSSALPTFLRAIRLHQWVKNLLLGVPLLAGHKLGDPQAVLGFAVSFLVFGLMASSVYLINDLSDLTVDRKHAGKRHRPLAAGAMSIAAALLTAICFSIGSLTLACWLLPGAFVLWLGFYLIATLAYSFCLKRRLLVDVITLAFLYTLRILAGGAAQNIPVTEWLLAFSMFIFTSLAFAKRFIEIEQTALDKNKSLSGRDYQASDLDIIRVVGPTNGYLAVLVLALYIHSPDVRLLYRHPKLLWLICPLLVYWMTRVWFLANRGTLHHDPVVFALRDPKSYLVAILGIAVVLVACL